MAVRIEEGFSSSKFGKTWYRMVNPKGANLPAILLHGGPGAAHDMLKCLEVLAHDRPVVLYDQIGCGRSSRLAAPHWKPATFVADLEALRQTLGFKQFHLLGHSWGTMFGVDYCLAYSNRVRSAIFSSPCLSASAWIADCQRLIRKLPQQAQRAIAKAEQSGIYDTAGFKAANDLFMARHCCRLKKRPTFLAHTGIECNRDGYQRMWGPSEFCATGTLKHFERTAHLPLLPMPCLYTCGEFDEATPATVGGYAAATPQANFHMFRRASHLPMYETPGEYQRVIERFWRGT